MEHKLTPIEITTIIAALRYLQDDNYPDDIEILEYAEIDDLCENLSGKT